MVCHTPHMVYRSRWFTTAIIGPLLGLSLLGCANTSVDGAPTVSAPSTTSPGDAAGELAVTGVALQAGDDSLVVDWDPPTGSAKVEEYQAFALDTDGLAAYQCASSETSCTMTDVSAGTYTAIVRATYADGQGPVSAESSPVEVK